MPGGTDWLAIYDHPGLAFRNPTVLPDRLGACMQRPNSCIVPCETHNQLISLACNCYWPSSWGYGSQASLGPPTHRWYLLSVVFVDLSEYVGIILIRAKLWAVCISIGPVVKNTQLLLLLRKQISGGKIVGEGAWSESSRDFCQYTATMFPGCLSSFVTIGQGP